MRLLQIITFLLLLVMPAGARELLRNGHFTALDGWWATGNLSMSIGKGGLCANVPAGTAQPWDAIIGQDGISLLRGQGYRLQVTLSGAPAGSVSVQLQSRTPPYTPIVQKIGPVGPKPEKWQLDFVSAADADDLQLSIQVGGRPESWRICVREASLRDDVRIDTQVPTGDRIAVNQVGYLPGGPKRATLVTEKVDPVAFAVRDAKGKEMFAGRSQPRGLDPLSGLNVHVLDFTSLADTGDGITLVTEDATSTPFSVADGLFTRLRRDAFSFFYPMRSGVEIKGDIAGEAYARAAGHVSRPSGPGPNRGDIEIPCRPAQLPPGEPASDCDYTIDAEGGWYDAGDQGKYVVNGAVSAAQLLLAYEDEAKFGGSGLTDGTLAIPEASNGQPDALDEARWELDWMLRMVVPDGQPLAGMLHHKVQDDQWTGIPTLPADDPRPREGHAPSTAATLDFAASAAIASRVFKKIDSTYSDRLSAAAVKAYAAAKAHPAELFLAQGYDDSDVRDEFFWAAAELYILTGNAIYLADLQASPAWNANLYIQDGYSWQQVAPLAALELAANSDRLPPEVARKWLEGLPTGAKALAAHQQGEAFGQALTPSDGKFGWGSNAQLIGNLVVLAKAADLSDDKSLRSAAIEGADYLLGRNALGQSYITGYGTNFSRNQHSRWFARARDPNLPNPPIGAIAGGPNAHLQDPVMQARFAAKPCAPMLCYVDDIDAYSVNEIAINWNAALALYATWLARQR